jgi:hypothetical protein
MVNGTIFLPNTNQIVTCGQLMGREKTSSLTVQGLESREMEFSDLNFIQIVGRYT